MMTIMIPETVEENFRDCTLSTDKQHKRDTLIRSNVNPQSFIFSQYGLGNPERTFLDLQLFST